MPTWNAQDLPLINSAADKFVQLIIDNLTDQRGVHIETAIGTAGSIAGVAMLRSAVTKDGINLDPLIRTKPGTPVFVDRVNEIGPEVTEFMSAFCKPMGIDPQTGWNMPIPEDHVPHKSISDMVQNFEKPFNELTLHEKITGDLRPFVAALAAIKLIKMGKDVLNPDIGKAITITVMVAASKTVPAN